MTTARYFERLKMMLLQLEFVEEVIVREELITDDFGYLRLRFTLSNGDIVELFEYVVKDQNAIRTVNYSFHLQDANAVLLKRWDNAPHHPELESFPHHLHHGKEVFPSRPMNSFAFLTFLKRHFREGRRSG